MLLINSEPNVPAKQKLSQTPLMKIGVLCCKQLMHNVFLEGMAGTTYQKKRL